MEEPARPLPVTLRYRALRADRGRLRALLRHCLEAERAPEGFGVGLVLAGPRTLRRLNRDWLGRDRPTDVLSFPYYPLPLPAGMTPAEPAGGETEARLLGEVVVSLPRCLEQARERDVDPGTELVRLVVHGCLHVLGYDHLRSRDRARMLPRERRLRSWAARRRIGPRLLEAR